MDIIEKGLTPVISAILFAAFLSGIHQLEYFTMIFVLSLPVFLIAGSICSYFVEYYVLEKIKVKQRIYKYIVSVSFYGLVGVIAILVISLIEGSILEIGISPLLFLGIIPALTYYHLSLAFKLILSRLSLKY